MYARALDLNILRRNRACALFRPAWLACACAAFAGRNASGIRRRRARTGIARPYPARFAAAGTHSEAGGRFPCRDRCGGVHARPWAGRRAAGRREHCQWLGLCLGAASDCIHHLEGHLLSPLLASAPPSFPFVALLVSGGHTQLMEVSEVGVYRTLGETLDDAAGEAFDKTAKLLGLDYPGGPAVSKLAESGASGVVALPRPMLHSKDLNFSFSGLKTAVSTHIRRAGRLLSAREKADLARGFVEAVVEVLVSKSVQALAQTGLKRLVVAGGVGANRQLRAQLAQAAQTHAFEVFYPDVEFCTDNGAMIALAGALRLQRWPEQASRTYAFTVRPRWDLSAL